MTIAPTRTNAIGCPVARAAFPEKSENHEDFLLTDSIFSISFAYGQSNGRGNLPKRNQAVVGYWVNLH